MTKPMVRIHNTEIDEIIDREMNDAEYAQHLKDVQEEEVRKAEAEAKAATRQALLTRLGITEEEARILLGGN
jgi:hypothetical protein